MRFVCLTTVFFAFHLLAFSQSSPTQMTQSTRDQINFNGLAIPRTAPLYGVAGESGKVLGSPYLDSTWQTGTIRFYGKINATDSLAGIPLRLDLVNHDVEIRVGAHDIRSAKAPMVRYVLVNHTDGSLRRYVNAREYRAEADPLAGFFEQLAKGKLTLLDYSWIHIKKPTFNPALNTGTKDAELVQKMDWYVVQNEQAGKFSPSKKAVLELMADKKEAIETFLKTEKPDLKTRVGLVAVFTYYNQL